MSAPQPAPTTPGPPAPAGQAGEPHLAKAPELKALTGIRAVAAAMVVLSHIKLPETAPVVLRHVVDSGYIGVPLFFVLSGFVLAYNYPDVSTRDGRGLLRFYLARAARVLPLYYVVLGYLVVFNAARDRSLLGLPQHLLNIQTWSGNLQIGQIAFNGPSWSINVEVFFYLLFPLLMPVVATLARRLTTRSLIAVAVGVLAVQWVLCIVFAVTGWADLAAADPMSGHRWLYRNPLPRLVEFVTGMLLAVLFTRGVLQRRRYADAVQIGMVALALVLTVVRPWEGPSAGIWRVASFGALYAAPFAVLLLSLASGHGVLARWLSTRVMLNLGVASFAVYLTHRPFLESFGAAAVRQSDDVAGWVLVPLVLGMTLVIGEGAHRYIEVPARRMLLKRVGRWLPADRQSGAHRSTRTPA